MLDHGTLARVITFLWRMTKFGMKKLKAPRQLKIVKSRSLKPLSACPFSTHSSLTPDCELNVPIRDGVRQHEIRNRFRTYVFATSGSVRKFFEDSK